MIRRKLSDLVHGKAPLFASRSPAWTQVRTCYLAENPFCQACGGKEKLEVHHIIPFHEAPHLELEPTNLITLCESGKYGINCHLFVGHKGNYRDVNSSVRSLAVFLFSYLSRKTQL